VEAPSLSRATVRLTDSLDALQARLRSPLEFNTKLNFTTDDTDCTGLHWSNKKSVVICFISVHLW
jgi:hypothetical protein